jgi:hypothetical protein
LCGQFATCTILIAPLFLSHALIVVVAGFVTTVVAYATPVAPAITTKATVAKRRRRRAKFVLMPSPLLSGEALRAS